MTEADSNKEAANGKGWFTDDQGNPSSMRLMSMLALLVASRRSDGVPAPARRRFRLGNQQPYKNLISDQGHEMSFDPAC